MQQVGALGWVVHTQRDHSHLGVVKVGRDMVPKHEQDLERLGRLVGVIHGVQVFEVPGDSALLLIA